MAQEIRCGTLLDVEEQNLTDTVASVLHLQRKPWISEDIHPISFSQDYQATVGCLDRDFGTAASTGIISRGLHDMDKCFTRLI